MSALQRSIVFIACVLGILTSSQGQITQWGGTVSSSWRNADNWTSGVPGPSKDASVSVSSSTTGLYDLFVPAPAEGDTATVDKLSIMNGGVVRFDAAPAPGHLIVNGSTLSLNGGQLILGTGKILFRNNVQINNGGDIDAGTGTLEFQGNLLANSGSQLNLISSTVVLSGSGDQSISGDVVFNDLVVATSGTVTLNGTITVMGSVIIEAGSTLFVPSSTTFHFYGSISGEGLYINEGASLPVQMTALRATARGEGVTLQWSTASEVNNHGFSIERRTIGSGSGSMVYVPIGFVAGSGTSTAWRDYAFVDASVTSGRYAYRVTSIDRDGTTHEGLEVETEVEVPPSVALLPNFPNPFNPSTMVSFRLSADARVRLSVFDAAGREVAVLVDGDLAAGEHRVTWDASGLPSAVYFSRLAVDGQVSVRSMQLLK